MNEMNFNCKNQCVCGELLGVEMVKGKSGRRAFWQVKCTKCGRETAKYTKPEGALMAWNRRRVSGEAATMADVLRNEKCENVFASGKNWESEQFRKKIFMDAMAKKEVTARDVAKKFDVTEVTLWRIINGDTQLDKLKEISDYLGVEVYISQGK